MDKNLAAYYADDYTVKDGFFALVDAVDCSKISALVFCFEYMPPGKKMKNLTRFVL